MKTRYNNYNNQNDEDVYNDDDDDDDEDSNYAEIDVVTTNDYYYITNLNHYYQQEHLKSSQHHSYNNDYKKSAYDSSSSSSWSSFTQNNNTINSNKYQATKNQHLLTTCANFKSHQQQYSNISEKLSGSSHAFKVSSTPSNILRNTHKRCRRKLFDLNFMFKNFITYRFKYDIL